MILTQDCTEWLQSGVSQEIIDLNVESLDDPREIDRRLNRNAKERHKHWNHGAGWWVSGVDPFNGDRTLLGGQFKPYVAVLESTKQDGTPRYRKYFSASGYEATPLFLAMPDAEYWQKVRVDISCALFHTEGAKKAGALLSRGVAAISIPGVWNGQKKGQLHKLINEYSQLGRNSYLAFDADWRQKPGVFQALERYGRLLAGNGCIVRVLVWDESQGKGIDDYLANGGNLEEVIANALTFEEWREYKQELPKSDSNYPDFSYLKPEDEVTNRTIDDHVYQRLFESGQGDFMVLNSAFYRYTGKGYWAHTEDEEIEAAIAQYSRKAYKAQRDNRGDIVKVTFPYAKTGSVSSAFNFSRTLLTSRKPKDHYKQHLLCFANCTVDLRTGDVMEHSPGHYLTSTICAEYEPNQPCPDVFGEFVYSVFGEDLFEVIQAVTSMLLDPTAPYGQFPHLIGPSGSGKGTTIELWESMFGDDNVRSAASLSELSTPEGRYQNLIGTRLFTCPDIGGYQQGLRAFYNLVDNVPMSARPLFSKRNIQVRYDTRFAIASVDHLIIENSGDGWDRRAIPLPTRSRKGEMNRGLKAELQTKKAQIISWALSMPRERRDYILNNLHQFAVIENAKSESSLAGDSTRSFVDMCLRPAPGNKRKVYDYELHTWYSAYCATFGYQKQGMSRFIGHLKNVVPANYVARRRATAAEDPDRPILAPYFIELEPLEGVFVEMSEDGDSCRCVKSNCEAGGLWRFPIYAAEQSAKLMNNEKMDRSGSGTLKKEKTSPIRDEAPRDNGSGDSDRTDRGDRGLIKSAKNEANFVIEITPQKTTCDLDHNTGNNRVGNGDTQNGHMTGDSAACDLDHQKNANFYRMSGNIPDPSDPSDPNHQKRDGERVKDGSGMFIPSSESPIHSEPSQISAGYTGADDDDDDLIDLEVFDDEADE